MNIWIYDYIWLYMTIYECICICTCIYGYVDHMNICIMWLPMCFHGDNFDFGPARKPFLLWEIGWNTAPQVGRNSRRVDDWDYTPLILASKKSENCKCIWMHFARLEHTCVPHTTCPCPGGWARSALRGVAASAPQRASSSERAQDLLEHLLQRLGWHLLHLPSPEFPGMFWLNMPDIIIMAAQ